MSSPIIYAHRHSKKDDENDYDSPSSLFPTNEQVGNLYKDKYKKFMESFTVSNSKVRYYCNKALAMRQPLYEILDDLVRLQYHSMAYLPKDCNATDHYALSMTFTLISKTASMIEWNRLNHDCFWDDFCRETRELKFLIDRVQGVALECVYTATAKANQAFEILKGVVPTGKKSGDIRLAATMFQSSGDPSLEGIKVIWMEPRETVIIQWNDIDTGVQSIKLQQTGDSFRLRFLRCLIFYARKCLELTLFTMLRIDVALRLQFSLEKLGKCQGLTSGELLTHERGALRKAKRDFDGNWDDIWGTVTRFKFQLDQLERHKVNLKRLRKDSKSASPLEPFADSLILQIEDPLLLKIVSQAISSEMKKESYDFTMYPDRTDDILCIIEDMWVIDKASYKKVDMLLILLYTALVQVQPVLNKKEASIFQKDLNNLFMQKNRVKRYLKTAMDVFKHNAFLGMSLLHQHGYAQLQPTTLVVRSTRSSLDALENEYDGFDDEDMEGTMWIELPGGYKVTVNEEKEFKVVNQFKDQLHFNHLDEEQKVVLTTKLLSRLIHYVANEGCKSKIVLDRARETKSLFKRMKPRDRSTEFLGTIIGNGVYHIQQWLKLMKTMDVIHSIPF